MINVKLVFLYKYGNCTVNAEFCSVHCNKIHDLILILTLTLIVNSVTYLWHYSNLIFL